VEDEPNFQQLAERLDFGMLALFGFAHGLLQPLPEMPLTPAEHAQVRAALAAIKKSRRRVADAAETLGRIACATRDRHKNN
jgi:hypothetical protein